MYKSLLEVLSIEVITLSKSFISYPSEVVCFLNGAFLNGVILNELKKSLSGETLSLVFSF